MLIVAMIYIIIAIIVMIYKKLNYFNILIFFILGIIFKALPFYVIRNDPTTMRDIIFGVLLFFLYLLWVYYRKGPNEFIKIYTVYIFEFKTPFMQYIK